jgi:cathepsin A (carboxypeptidase C)
MIDFYRKLAPKLERTIVFNGDTDPCVSYEGTREAIIKIGFDELEGGSQRPYFYNASGVDVGVLQSKPLLYGPNLAVIDAGPQFAGHVTDYVNNLSFVTVHGSGHMVPQFRPQVGLLIIKKLVTSESFAPPLPRNDALESMKEEDFEKSMEHWVIEAQATKYIDA